VFKRNYLFITTWMDGTLVKSFWLKECLPVFGASKKNGQLFTV